MCLWSSKAVISNTGIFVAIANNTLYESKLYIFLLCQKIIRILKSCSMKIFSKFSTVNISKLNFWLVICIAKNFIWTTLKMIFSIFRFFCTLRFQIYKYCSIITNHTSMESYLFSFQMMHKSQFPKNWPLWLVLCSRVTNALCIIILKSLSLSFTYNVFA